MNDRHAPQIFEKPIASIDLAGLPPRDSPGFGQALTARWALEYADKGWTALVTADDESVRVVAIPGQAMGPKTYALGLLKERRLQAALPILEALYAMVDDAEIAYGYGICLSELRRYAEAVEPFERCVQLNKVYANAHIGLGIAYARLGRYADAERALRQAIQQHPTNAYAKRNLATVLACCGKGHEALQLFRQAASLAPNEPGAQLGLAECLDHLGGDHRAEADRLYAQIARRFGDHPVAEMAQRARNRIANEQSRPEREIRMDAVFYMRAASDDLCGKSAEEIRAIVAEIAALRQKGLEDGKAYVRYALQNLPGDFSGLQLLSILHAGIRLIDPDADTGTGLDREFEVAAAAQAKN